MSRINQKLGLKPAGKRRQMKDVRKVSPVDAKLLTSIQCPRCGHAWIVETVIHGKPTRMCAWCSNFEGLF